MCPPDIAMTSVGPEYWANTLFLCTQHRGWLSQNKLHPSGMLAPISDKHFTPDSKRNTHTHYDPSACADLAPCAHWDVLPGERPGHPVDLDEPDAFKDAQDRRLEVEAVHVQTRHPSIQELPAHFSAVFDTECLEGVVMAWNDVK